MNNLNDLSFFPYQSDWLKNQSRFKIGLWARQTGKDYTCAAEAVLNCWRTPNSFWIIVAAGERQALESLSKARDIAQQIQFAIDSYDEEKTGATARLQSAEIKWSNGSRLLALPANPQTIRGYSANLILTEFAFHENPGEIWRAIYPSISNPLRGGLKKLRIISTPNGLNNKFADLWHNTLTLNPDLNLTPGAGSAFPLPGGEGQGEGVQSNSEALTEKIRNPVAVCKYSAIRNGYFKSLLTIHDAIAAGLPLNAGELKLGLNDEEAWNQEYLCQFMDTSSVLLPYALIESCESSDASESLADFTANPSVGSWIQRDAQRTALIGLNGQLYAGIDFGRKNHLTVCWLFQRLNNKLVTREVLTLKNMSTPDQLNALRPRLKRCQKACIDYTGAGIGLGDYLVKEFAEWNLKSHKHGKVELCQFTPALKAELFPRLRVAFEKSELQIPPSREIREDLHGIHRIVTNSGQITYRAHGSSDGHSDRCTALALALRAATNTPASFGAVVIRRPAKVIPWNARSWTIR